MEMPSVFMAPTFPFHARIPLYSNPSRLTALCSSRSGLLACELHKCGDRQHSRVPGCPAQHMGGLRKKGIHVARLGEMQDSVRLT